MRVLYNNSNVINVYNGESRTIQTCDEYKLEDFLLTLMRVVTLIGLGGGRSRTAQVADLDPAEGVGRRGWSTAALICIRILSVSQSPVVLVLSPLIKCFSTD